MDQDCFLFSATTEMDDSLRSVSSLVLSILVPWIKWGSRSQEVGWIGPCTLGLGPILSCGEPWGVPRAGWQGTRCRMQPALEVEHPCASLYSRCINRLSMATEIKLERGRNDKHIEKNYTQCIKRCPPPPEMDSNRKDRKRCSTYISLPTLPHVCVIMVNILLCTGIHKIF